MPAMKNWNSTTCVIIIFIHSFYHWNIILYLNSMVKQHEGGPTVLGQTYLSVVFLVLYGVPYSVP